MEVNVCEMLIASTARINIIKVLMEESDIRVMILKRKVGCRYNELDRNLKKLEAAGVITDESKPDLARQPKARIIHFLLNEPNTEILVETVKVLSKADKRNTHKPSKGPLFPKFSLTEKQLISP
jgi:Predicted transcriptional regulator